MRFELTNTQRDIQKAAKEFAEKEFDSDLALEFEKEGKFPKSIVERACHLGFVGINYPEKFGGQSLGLFENVLVTEAFCKTDSGIGISINLADMASGIILRHGDEDQIRKFVTPVAQGKMISTVAMTDLQKVEERRDTLAIAEESSYEYVLSGGKICAINGTIADYIVVFLETTSKLGSNDRKLVTLVVERNQQGVNILGTKKTMGMRMSPLAEISFDHARVPKNQVIGEECDGIEHVAAYLIERRIKTAAQALGIAQGAFDLAVKHSKQREQFGRKICQFQGIQFMMAELYTLIEAARSLVYRTGWSYDAELPDLERISSVTKLFATDVAVRATIDSIQIHGGMGLMKEYSIERKLRDAKTIQNLEETNLFQKAMIAKKIIS